MVFFYDSRANEDVLRVDGESFHYLFRVRRHKVKDKIVLSNLKDSTLYYYEVTSVEKNSAYLNLVESKKNDTARDSLHIVWCMVDPKVVEKTLPMLNELGVTLLTLVYCQRSQANFRISSEKIEKILISSSQQCGRIDPMSVEVGGTLQEFVKQNPDTVVIDFGGQAWSDTTFNRPYLVGCEGGFTQDEREMMSQLHKISLKSNTVLRSETVVIAVASKFAL